MKIGIVSHFGRIRLADKLLREVRADAISVDRGMYGHKINHIRVWRSMANITGSDEWAIVLEDDAWPCPEFRQQAQAALDTCGGDFCSMYLGKSRPIHWQDRIYQATARAVVEDAPWIVGDVMLHGVAIALRGNRIQGMIDYLLACERIDPIDEAITSYVRRTYSDVWYTFPSIVEHLDMPTLIAHPDGEPREPGRHAWKFGTRTEWNQRKVTL